jgi:Kef-type K+ transport system membrane component KefB
LAFEEFFNLFVLEDVLLLIIVTYSISLSFGYILQKYLRMPWMFSSLFLGLILSALGLFGSTIESDLFKLLETLGMYLLLFIIGYSIEFKKMAKLRNQVILGTVVIISCEGFFGSLLLYLVFPAGINNSYLVALITAFSFATVGEAVLLPILNEFKIIKTTFGQLTLGIGTLDDIVEVLMLTTVSVLPAFLPIVLTQNFPDPLMVLTDLALLLLLTLIMIKVGGRISEALEENHLPSFMYSLLTLLVFFSFIALGNLVTESVASVGAIFGGMVLRELLPKEKLIQNEQAIEFLGYIFLSPFFFLSVGASVSLTSIIVSPLLVSLILLVANGSKYLASVTLFRRLLGFKYASLLGIGLGIRFSTSLVVQFILLKSGLITLDLYSSLIAAAIIATPVIIIAYSWALSRGKPP